MINGPSGFLSICPPWNMPTYSPSNRILEWPNGAYAMIRSGAQAETSRGPGVDTIWFDEIAAWKYPDDVYLTALPALDSGHTRGIITSTPRPIPIWKRILSAKRTHLTEGTTYENIHNLGAAYRLVVEQLEGTRLGLQELYGKLLKDTPGAQWGRTLLEAQRVKSAPDLQRIVVAIDPQGSTNRRSGGEPETGIVVAGHSHLDYGYLLDDLSGNFKPVEWAKAAVDAYRTWKADCIVAETNYGGDMVVATIHAYDPNVPVKVVHASRGKAVRAEPVSTLYEQKRIWHVGMFAELEDQMCTYTGTPGEMSPDRLDAAVWAFWELFGLDVGKKEEVPEDWFKAFGAR